MIKIFHLHRFVQEPEISEAVMIDGLEMGDGDRYYSSAFSRALDGMVSCIRRHLPEPGQRRPHIKYLYRMFTDSRLGWVFGEDYHSALSRICSDREDLQFWKDLHGPALDRAPPDGSGPGHR